MVMFQSGELAPTIGHNKAPGPIEQAKEALTELNAFLTENPVIEQHDQARQAGGWIERTRISLKALEDEQKDKASPLRTKLDAIYASYRVVREPLEKVLLELRRRVTAYTTAEEQRRAIEAAKAREEAERVAAEAQAAIDAANNAMAAADVGECIDAGAAIADATYLMTQANKAERTAVRVERATTVRIGSVMGGRALAARTVEVLVIADAAKAIKVMGLTDKIRDAILSSARDFRKAYEELPEGIIAEQQRSV
jgi:hypothetical protein